MEEIPLYTLGRRLYRGDDPPLHVEGRHLIRLGISEPIEGVYVR